ncbi:MDIS1-interacting receptor like kinase 2-like [Dioscorea cayenensis subsp. rotundata]|uniref:MDIS1-interacting receptor like kinase 2-like n=1 Tax=Dioscorea cayennensis subsp. rotundata TaxID=55577 RepID=A0AB40CXI9_DIOCR|nr:MDIS1-interacting receptor like kinase 2-like [Dioscorea cayenensis subsp. rotundata]
MLHLRYQVVWNYKVISFIAVVLHHKLSIGDWPNSYEMACCLCNGSSQLSLSSQTLISGFLAVISVNFVIALYVIMVMKEPTNQEPQPDPTFLDEARMSITQPSRSVASENSETRDKVEKLEQNYLTGPLPAFIGNLTALQTLGIDTNKFNGSLPSELGNLTNLQQVYMDSCVASGGIPPTLANLKQLSCGHLTIISLAEFQTSLGVGQI